MSFVRIIFDADHVEAFLEDLGAQSGEFYIAVLFTTCVRADLGISNLKALFNDLVACPTLERKNRRYIHWLLC